MRDARVHPVDHRDHLVGIQALQAANLRRTVGEDEAAREGFVTAEYTVEFLQAMHEVAPSIVTTDEDETGRRIVVGYALVTDRSVGMSHPLLRYLFEATDRQTWNGVRLRDVAYVVCGQLCVAKSHRGLGLADRMYRRMCEEYSTRWDGVVTDVVTDNPRSLRAHARVGFDVVTTIAYGGAEWKIVLWDWRGAA
jgi:GNAT superfamily N-acetyltransferase